MHKHINVCESAQMVFSYIHFCSWFIISLELGYFTFAWLFLIGYNDFFYNDFTFAWIFYLFFSFVR